MLCSVYRAIQYQLSRMVRNNKELLLHEADKITGFMRLLMKPRNTKVKWTKEERRLLKTHLRHLSYYVPALVIFVMPFGSLLIPLLAEVLDRRKAFRKTAQNGFDAADSG
jgi:ribosomal protein L24E